VGGYRRPEQLQKELFFIFKQKTSLENLENVSNLFENAFRPQKRRPDERRETGVDARRQELRRDERQLGQLDRPSTAGRKG